MRVIVLTASVMCCLLATALCSGETLHIGGEDLPRQGDLGVAELEALSPATVTWTMHGVSHSVTGVPLEQVLTRFGYEPGPMGKSVPPAEKRLGFRKVVVGSAVDGFQAVFSTAELTEAMGLTKVYVVWRIDSKPLPAESGPFRLVVTTDKEPSRCLYKLVRLQVVDMRRVAQPADVPAPKTAAPLARRCGSEMCGANQFCEDRYKGHASDEAGRPILRRKCVPLPESCLKDRTCACVREDC